MSILLDANTCVNNHCLQDCIDLRVNMISVPELQIFALNDYNDVSISLFIILDWVLDEVKKYQLIKAPISDQFDTRIYLKHKVNIMSPFDNEHLKGPQHILYGLV